MKIRVHQLYEVRIRMRFSSEKNSDEISSYQRMRIDISLPGNARQLVKTFLHTYLEILIIVNNLVKITTL